MYIHMDIVFGVHRLSVKVHVKYSWVYQVDADKTLVDYYLYEG